MTEGGAGQTAGSLLRAAREKQGLHIAALAAAIKVSPHKLDALENDRYDELPDATFARALAQTVCRSLRIDPQPVLNLLPRADAASLEHVAGTLNTPFRDRNGGPTGLAAAAIRPLMWASGLLMLAAVVVYFLPSNVWQPGVDAVVGAVSPPAAPASEATEGTPGMSTTTIVPPAAAVIEPAASVPPVAAAASEPVVETVHAAPQPASGASAPELNNLLVLRASEPSWIEVRDANGQVLFSRTVQVGERVGLDGVRPLKLVIGNAAATQVFYRGQPVGVVSSARDNVARLELQ